MRNKIKSEIAEKQCGLVEGKGATVYTLQTKIERALEVQKELICASLTTSKTFDRVRHGNHTTNTDEHRWKRSTGDQKHT